MLPRLPYQGRWIHVDEDRKVTWVRCARCNRKLSDPESMARGYGPECMTAATVEELEACKEAAREKDREPWRKEQRYQAMLERQRQARELRRRRQD